ncbi:hypothetical protein GCM10007052_15180 [Halioglobus japonicus]|nr:hypothetical protein GCM10007052_15180 [Halioglobus japonicus]
MRIENFKGIGREVEFKLRPITLFYGQNSSGKSTVLHSLNYLNDLLNHHAVNADGTSLGEGSIDLGGFSQFVHQHDLKREVKLGIDLDLWHLDLSESEAAASYIDLFASRQVDYVNERLMDISEATSRIQNASLDLTVAWSDTLSRPYVKKLMIGFNGAHFATISSSSDCRRIELSELYLDHYLSEGDESEESEESSSYSEHFSRIVDTRYLDDDGQAMIGLMEMQDALPEVGKPLQLSNIWTVEDWEGYEVKAEFRGLLAALIIGPLEVASASLQQLCYLGPIRQVPGRDYKPRKGSGYNWADGLSAWDALFMEDESLRADVNKWMHGENEQETSLLAGYTVKLSESKILPLGSRLMGLLQSGASKQNQEEIKALLEELDSDSRITLWDEKRQIAVHPEDVGIGISQILPVVVAALSDKAKLLSIEQPELHVHPRMQAAVGDLLIHSAKQLHKTFLLETHSEHLMLRLLRRIRESAEYNNPVLMPDDIGVVYVDCIEGETRLIPIRIAQDGKFLDRWPKGFFAERAEELF